MSQKKKNLLKFNSFTKKGIIIEGVSPGGLRSLALSEDMHRVNIRASDISRGSGKSAKSCEIHKNTQNTAKFGRNLIKYMSVQQF